jgi:hypothetical protein
MNTSNVADCRVSSTQENRFERVKIALLKYKELNGNILVKNPFVVPSENAEWPEEVWGLKLGEVVMSIRSGHSYKEKKEEMLSIGFNFDCQRKRNGFERIKAALSKYKEIYGNLLVKQCFTIQNGVDEWPEDTWGLKLGQIVKGIRSGHSCKDNRAELEEMGFNFTSQHQRFSFDAIKAALIKYKEFHGDMAVKQGFVVDNHAPDWPEETC